MKFQDGLAGDKGHDRAHVGLHVNRNGIEMLFTQFQIFYTNRFPFTLFLIALPLIFRGLLCHSTRTSVLNSLGDRGCEWPNA